MGGAADAREPLLSGEGAKQTLAPYLGPLEGDSLEPFMAKVEDLISTGQAFSIHAPPCPAELRAPVEQVTNTHLDFHGEKIRLPTLSDHQ